MLATATSDCVSETWRASDPEIEKIKTSSLPANEKRSRISAIAKKAELSVPTKCGNTLKQLEVGLTKVIEARNVERQAILEKARARAK